MRVDMPLGDVVDRVTILRIKLARLEAATQLANVRRELGALVGAWHDAGLREMDDLPEWEELQSVNGQLWDVEDALRAHERRKDFGTVFVELARSVYRLNDRRAELKRAINDRLGSRYVEEKSYTPYDVDEAGDGT